MRRVFLITFLMLVSLCSLCAVGGDFFLGHIIGNYSGESYFGFKFFTSSYYGDNETVADLKNLQAIGTEQYVGSIAGVTMNSKTSQAKFDWNISFTKMFLLDSNGDPTTDYIPYVVRIVYEGESIDTNTHTITNEGSTTTVRKTVDGLQSQLTEPLMRVFITLDIPADETLQPTAGDYSATMTMGVTTV